MFRYILFFILIIHGMIHFMGFAKAFGYGAVSQLTKDISRQMGAWWFFTAVLFIAAAVIFLTNKDTWWMTASVAAIISQVLIISSWQDAKFGTIANCIVIGAVIVYHCELI